jgi:tetratricopeptide (TPR) repeat protein
MVKNCHAAGGAWIGMRARFLIDTEEWTGDVAAMSASPPQPAGVVTHEFVNALGAVRRNDLPAARAAYARLQQARRRIEASAKPDPAHAGMPGMAMAVQDAGMLGRIRILDDEIAALLRHKAGATADAIDILRKAAALEDSLPFEFGPPFIDKPAYELLGEVLLEAGQPAEARAAFEKALARTPERTQALTGLMQTAARSGDRRKEDEIRAKLQAIRHLADRRD